MKPSSLISWHSTKLLKYVALIVCILFFGLRFVRYYDNIVVDHQDFFGDYLNAHYLVTYKDYPMIGQSNQIFRELPNSPLYNYFLGAFLLLRDDIYTLAYANSFLQIISIFFIWQLANVLFNKRVGYIALLLCAISQIWIHQFFFLWQPSVILPFICMSYYLLAYAYVHKKLMYVYVSVFAFAVASSFGYYTFPVIPLFFILLWYINKKITGRKKTLILLYVEFVFIFCIAYIPVIYHAITTSRMSHLLQNNTLEFSIRTIPINFLNNIPLFFSNIFVMDRLPIIAQVIFFVFLAYASKYALDNSSKSEKNNIYLLLVIAVIPLIAASISYTRDYWYFIAGVPSLIICIGFIIEKHIYKPLHLMCTLAICLSTVILTIPSTSKIKYVLTSTNTTKVIDEAVFAILPTINQIRNKYPQSWRQQFTIADVERSNNHNAFIGFLWPRLEVATQSRLLQNTKNGDPGFIGHNIEPMVYSPKYTFVVCGDFHNINDSISACLDKYFVTFDQNPSDYTTKLMYDGIKWKRFLVMLIEKTK